MGRRRGAGGEGRDGPGPGRRGAAEAAGAAGAVWPERLPRPPPKGLWAYVKDACQDTTLCILALCGIVSLVNIVSEGAETGWYDGVSIFGAVLVVIGVTAGNDYQQALQFQKLEDKNKEVTVEVVRDGRQASVSMYDVVVGDVLVLATGDQVCADGVCAQSASLQMDESSMTGESDLVRTPRGGRSCCAGPRWPTATGACWSPASA